jgi:hypothetical protein
MTALIVRTAAVQHVEDAAAALDVELSDEEILNLEQPCDSPRAGHGVENGCNPRASAREAIAQPLAVKVGTAVVSAVQTFYAARRVRGRLIRPFDLRMPPSKMATGAYRRSVETRLANLPAG